MRFLMPNQQCQSSNITAISYNIAANDPTNSVKAVLKQLATTQLQVTGRAAHSPITQANSYTVGYNEEHNSAIHLF